MKLLLLLLETLLLSTISGAEKAEGRNDTATRLGVRGQEGKERLRGGEKGQAGSATSRLGTSVRTF